MTTEFQWEGYKVSIRSRPAFKYLWMATETVALVEGVEVGHTGGFGFTENLTGTFPHGDRSSRLTLEIKADLITLVSVPYELAIDGSRVSQGRLKIDDWPLSFVTPAVLLLLLMFALLRLLHSL